MIERIAFTAYPCRDVATTRAWYESTLGLAFAGPYKENGVETYNEAHLGDGCFSLMSADYAEREPGSASSIVFEVRDIDAAVEQLQARGVRIESRFDGPVCRQVSISDPDGNKVTLHQKTR
jgi:predicted enzyme related to lactoylglutathione lyase